MKISNTNYCKHFSGLDRVTMIRVSESGQGHQSYYVKGVRMWTGHQEGGHETAVSCL